MQQAAALTPGVSFSEKGRGAVSRSSKMPIAPSNITTELLSDFAAGRLDPQDAQVIQDAINHDEVVAAAVADARRVNSRMNLWLATSAMDAPIPDAGRTQAAKLQ
jgi:hypothetical protein